MLANVTRSTSKAAPALVSIFIFKNLLNISNKVIDFV